MATGPIEVVYCPVCGQPKSKLRERLYGVPTCRRCIDGFTKRRSIAGVIDWIVLPIVLGTVTLNVSALLVLLVSRNIDDEGIDFPPSVVLAIVATAFVLPVLSFLLFCAKDGFSGYSPGKALCGLRAINTATGQPIGLLRSIMRNLPPTITLFLVLIVALQIRKGPRWGDGWAKSKVIWQKYAERTPFLSQGKGWVAEQTDVQTFGEALPVGDNNPYRAPLG